MALYFNSDEVEQPFRTSGSGGGGGSTGKYVGTKWIQPAVTDNTWTSTTPQIQPTDVSVTATLTTDPEAPSLPEMEKVEEVEEEEDEPLPDHSKCIGCGEIYGIPPDIDCPECGDDLADYPPSACPDCNDG